MGKRDLIMKKSLILIAALVSFQSSALTVSDCQYVTNHSYRIMYERQYGATLSNMVRTYSHSEKKDMMLKIVYISFEQTRWLSDRMRREASQDFASKIEVACMQRVEV